MTREEKIAAILNVIQNDNDKLLKLLKIVITNNINNIEDIRLDALYAQLCVQPPVQP